ncbi:Rne/Rng family ribonuclease [Kribbella sp. NPDC051952]|uniref:Rne/Rng family ribonuclease n=1 Tax=Kribbella sp. NPDC051952 TaxID=3154851 RepID=UPI00343FB666
MLDNEPTTEAADTAATAQPAANRRTAKKAAAAKTTTTRKRTVKKAAEAVPTQSDGETADPAPVKKTVAKKATAKKTAAKKAPAAKAPAKKAAKRPAKKTSAQDTFPELVEETTPADGGPVVESAPAAKKTARKRTAKKAVATDLVATDSPITDGPVADAESAPPAKRTRRRGNQTAASQPAEDSQSTIFPTADAPAEDTPAEEPTTRRTRRRAPAAAAVLFQAPTEVPKQAPAQAAATSPVEATPEAAETTPEPAVDEQPTTRRRRSRRGRDAEARETGASDTGASETHEPEARETDVRETEGGEPAKPSTRRSRAAAKASAPAQVADEDETTDEQADEHSDAQSEDGDESGEGTRRRRRRRGGRRRRKAGDNDSDDSSDEQSDDDEQDDSEAEAGSDDDQDASDADDDADGSGSSSRRRRRRRRRKGEDSVGAPDDPDETVVRVREPRSKNTVNEITAVEGSTRLEAKKQRRREGRAAGRRRAPIVTEAEFLARRESVERTMVIRSRDDLTQIAVSEDNVLVEHYVTTAEQSSLIGNVYLGRVQNVLPSMEAAFIDIGKGRNAVLYAGEVDWATLGGANGPRKIEQVLKSGQAVLVQVTKDPIGHKGARLTNQISLPGRYVVYVPRGGNGGISRKLPDTERNRLKTILKDIVPDEAGVIVRTAAEGASEEELTADVSRLQSFWEDIDKKSKNGQAPQLLYGEPDLLIRVVRDLFTEDFTKLVISGDRAFDQVREYVTSVAPHLSDRVEKWASDNDVFANFRIDEQIKKALDRKVWLPSGGSLIIDRTEAMTVVDVNTGKFTGSGGNLEETVTKNNLEAAEEIVRQLRLRDIGGIIVIDFIDMVLESNRDLVLRRLVECLGRDRTKHQVAEVTSLGLVQMTRKRIGTGLLEAFSENCDHCGGRGLILHDEPKESRRRDSRNGQDQNKPAAAQSSQSGQSDEPRKSSRRRGRGKGRSDDEQPETEAAQHNGDAAQRLAQIAAASAHEAKKADGDDTAAGTAEPTGYPVSAAGDEAVSPEATGFPAAEAAEATTTVGEAAEPAEATQNGATRTRRRRSSRGRGKAAAEGDTGTAGNDAAELVSSQV